MAKQGEQYKYKLRLRYIDSSNIEVEIDPQQVQYLYIDKDYENLNMPVICIHCSIEKNILDDMIRNSDNNIITLGIYKYDATNQNDNITEKYFEGKFVYILNEDLSRTDKIDNPDGIDSKIGNQQLKELVFYMIQQDAINNNRQTINGVYHNASTNSLILQASNYLGKMLLEPIKYDTKYDQVIIPPLDSISNYIAYLNNNLGVFYDSPYRFFIDFDLAYLVSSSGNPIRARNQYIYTIVIDVKEITPDVSEEPEAYVDLKSGKYTIGINSAEVEYVKNNITNKMVNRVTVINSKGEVSEQDIGKENKYRNVNTINQVMSISNNDTNTINNISYQVEASDVTITLVKNNLDASIFTPNKEYIINDPVHEIYSGKYILCSSKQIFIKRDENFIMSTVLKLKKSSE